MPDLSASQTLPHKLNSQRTAPALASLSDRLVALLLDFLIFSPIVSLGVASLLKKAKTSFLINPGAEEAFVAMGLLCALAYFLISLLQSFFLYFWQATPGQKFMHLQVVAYPQSAERLTLNQCLLRGFFWSTGVMALGIPFLEVASHPLRRAFHERVSDTLVVTQKITSDLGPMPIETRFLGSWMRMSFLFILLFLVGGFFRVFEDLRRGEYRAALVQAPYSCQEMPRSEAVGTQRLDRVLALFLLNEISPECLNREAEASLWNDPINSQGIAYLAKYFVADKDEQEKYYKLICESEYSEACVMARFFKEEKVTAEWSQIKELVLTAQILRVDELYEKKDFVQSLRVLESLQKVSELKAGVEKRYVRSAWALYEQDKKFVKGRHPASAEKSRSEWLEKIKDRYDLP